MRSKEYFDRIHRALSELYPPEEARTMAFILLEKYAGIHSPDIFLSPETEVVPIAGLEEALTQLLQHRPLQYITGETEFYGLRFTVNEQVLIPRPETEELVDWIVREWQGRFPAILDIGTGSGALAVSLAKSLKGARVAAVDISAGALETAAENARSNGVEVSISKLDILTDTVPGTYDVMVSNPPYVRRSEKAWMRPNVVEYEPEVALFVPDEDPLLFYRRIAALGTTLLNDGGALYFEINEAFGRKISELLHDFGYTQVEVREDIYDKNRMAKGGWKK